MSLSSAGAASPGATKHARRIGFRRLAPIVLARGMVDACPGLTAVFAVSSLAVASCAGGLVLAAGAAIGAIPDAVTQGPGSPGAHRVQVAVAVMAGFFVAQQVAGGVQEALTRTIGRRLDADLRSRVCRALSRAPTLGHLDDPEVQQLVARATTVGTARYGVTAALDFGLASINGVTSAVWMAFLLGTFRWWLAVLVTAMWLLVRTYVHREAITHWAVLGFQTSGSQRSVYFRDLGLTPPAAKEIRVFGLGHWIVDRFSEHWTDAADDERDRKKGSHASSLLVVPIVAMHLLAFLMALNAVWSGAIDLRRFAVTLQAILGLAVLGASWRDQVVVAWGAATVPPVWDLERWADQLDAGSRRNQVGAESNDDNIAFRDVTFAYPRRSRPVLDGLTLDIPAGRSLALVGSNGAGKTTIVKLLCGLIEAGSGQVVVGGRPLSDLDQLAWRRSVAVLFQDFVHYPFSAAENITFGAIEARPDRTTLDKVAERSGLTEVVAALPGGWDTPLNRQFSGGADLSGGQWQRIALARTLWAIEAGARILVLDEPTANLDVRAEARFYEQFLGLTAGLTTVLVSHRFASVRLADSICVIDHGRVAEQGSHETLLATDGLYAGMFWAQAESYQTAEPAND